MTIRFSLFAGIVAGVLATAATGFAAPASAGPALKGRTFHAATVKAPHDFSARRHHWHRPHHWARPHLRHCTTVWKHHRRVTVCR